VGESVCEVGVKGKLARGKGQGARTALPICTLLFANLPFANLPIHFPRFRVSESRSMAKFAMPKNERSGNQNACERQGFTDVAEVCFFDHVDSIHHLHEKFFINWLQMFSNTLHNF